MRRCLSLLVLLLLPAVTAFAQQAPPPALVGRVAFVQGQLAFHAASETQWSAAAVNYPVAAGTSFWTAPQARAEFRIGPQTIDLAGNTSLDITKLDEHAMQLALREGRINIRLRELGQGDTVEIDLPRGKVALLQAGIYDIDAGTQERPARIAVFEGSARFAGAGADTAIKAGDAAVITGTTTLTAAIERATPDEFAEWCRSRDQQRPAVATAAKRGSPRLTGLEELEPYGAWRSVADHGEVWYPNDVPAGWAPYRDGNWAWVEPWGWNWVDAQPWGFAPSHYGRWAHTGGAWGWVPPAVGSAPVYAPALVAFLQTPAAALAGRARGPVVGWFPLGPGEPYWPGYTSDPAYIQAVNAGVVRDPARLDRAGASAALANRAAATIVPQLAFANGRRIGPAALRISDAKVQHAAAAAQAPSVRPGRQARGGDVRVARAAAAASPQFAHSGKAARAARSGGHGKHFARVGGGHGQTHFARHGGGQGKARFARQGGGQGKAHFARQGGGYGKSHFARGKHGGGHVGGGGSPGGMAHFGAGGGGGKHGGGGHGGGGKHGGGGHGGGGGKHGGGGGKGK